MQKLKLARPKGFTLRVKAVIEKNSSIFPKLLINNELYGCALAPRLKKGYHPIWEGNLQTLGPTFQLGAKQQAKNAQSWPQVFSALTPSVKRALVVNFSTLLLSFSFHHFMLDISFENRVILKVTFSSTLIFYLVDLVTFSFVMLSIKSQKDLTK
jgi:hypothetical protein